MKKNRLVIFLSILSVVLFFSNIFIVYEAGYFNKIINKLENKKVTYSYPEYERRVNVFKSMPASNNSTIFLGDSLIAGYNWEEKIEDSSVLNRGISGDTISGVSNRIDSLKNDNPKKIILMIGINDLNSGKDVKNIFDEYLNLIDEINQDFPNAELILTYLFNVNERIMLSTYPSYKITNDDINLFNSMLREKLSQEYTIIDLSKSINNNGSLKETFTFDGLHVTSEVYDLWIRELKL